MFYKFLSFKSDPRLQLPSIEVEHYSLVAVAVLDSYEFAIQFCSLVFLFMNLSLREILVISGRALKSRVPRLTRLRLSFVFVPAALCVILLAVQAAFSIREYLNFNYVNKDYFESTKELMPFTVFVCLPVQLAYLDCVADRGICPDCAPFYPNETHQQLKLENELLFRNKTFLQIENDTAPFIRRLVRRSYLQKGGTQTAWPIEIENETIFKEETFDVVGDEASLLTRCLRIDVNLKEMKYETNLAFTQLILELNYFDFRLFYVDFRNQLTWEDNPIGRKIRLYIIKKFRLPHPYPSNCLNYETYGCSEQDSCQDFCYNRNFYGNHSAISSKSVIYRKNFDKSVLSTARFSREEDKRIRSDCMAAYPNKDCQQVKFEEEFEHIEFIRDPNAERRIVIDLYLYKEVTCEVEQLTMYTLLFNLINFEAVLIGLNADKLFGVLVHMGRRSLRIREHLKFLSFFLTTLCLFGFLAHSFFIFIDIITSPLAKSESYERLMKISLPDFIICLETDLSELDEYEKFNGRYLDRLTSNLTFERIFDRITILGQNLSLFTVKAEHLRRNSRVIEISRTYLYNMKCFIFQVSISYTENDLFMIEPTFLAKIYFKPEVYAPDCNCLKFHIAFFERTKGTFEKLENFYLRRDNSSALKSAFLIQPVVMEFDYTDRFYFFKNPLALFKVER